MNCDPAQLWASLPLPALAIATDFTIQRVNMQAEAFLGASAKRMTGRDIRHFVEDSAVLIDQLQQMFSGRQSITRYDLSFSWEAARRGRVNLYLSQLPEIPSSVQMLIQPVGQAAWLHETQNRQESTLSVGLMAETVAHEIRNPLAGISGVAQFIEQALSADERRWTDMIQSEVKRIEKLVDLFDSFGNSSELNIEAVNIHTVLNHTKSLAQAGFGRHLTFRENYDPSLPMIAGDADKLTQICLNLLINATEALEGQKGTISLRTSYKPGVKYVIQRRKQQTLPIEISIADNGPGIPEHLQSQIFTPFLTTKKGGTGLGLALVAQMVAAHGGLLDFESEPGRTEFRIRLPIWREKEAG